VAVSCKHGNETSGFRKVLGISGVADPAVGFMDLVITNRPITLTFHVVAGVRQYVCIYVWLCEGYA
jgi:hypothetical protein